MLTRILVPVIVAISIIFVPVGYDLIRDTVHFLIYAPLQ